MFRGVVQSCLLLKVPPLVPLLLGEEGEILLVPTRVAPPAPPIQSGIIRIQPVLWIRIRSNTKLFSNIFWGDKKKFHTFFETYSRIRIRIRIHILF
jgi:hypothetical protein